MIMGDRLIPLGDRVLVRRMVEDEERKTEGGIHLPDIAKEKPLKGIVVEVGKGRTLRDGSRVPLDVSEGDEVLFARYAGTELKINDKEYLVLREDEVLAVL